MIEEEKQGRDCIHTVSVTVRVCVCVCVCVCVACGTVDGFAA